MKHRSTTPVSKRVVTKISLVASAVLVAVAVPISFISRPQTVKADSYDTQISQLQAQANQYQAQADQLGQQANTLQNQLDQLNNQEASIQAQINLSQAQYDQLTTQITQTQTKIKNNQVALGETLTAMYVSSDTTTLEMLASSTNIADYLDKQQYQSNISTQLSGTIKTITALKTQLQTQQASVATVLAKQNAQKNALVATQQQQQAILAQTQGQEAAYQQQVSATRAQMAAVAAQQQAYYASLVKRGASANAGVSGSFVYSNWSGNEGCSGGYAFCYGLDNGIDPWGLYTQECVSYVAWALANKYHKQVEPFNGQGNAYQWPTSAPEFSGASRVYSPQPGDAVILPPTSDGFAPTGHAMIVDSVNGDGSMNVSQFNFYGTGEYSTMTIQNSGVILLRFPSA